MACKICESRNVKNVHGNGFVSSGEEKHGRTGVRYIVHTGIGVQIVKCMECGFASVEFVHPSVISIIYERPPLAFLPKNTLEIHKLHKNNCLNQLRFFQEFLPKVAQRALFLGVGRSENATGYRNFFNTLYTCDLVPAINKLASDSGLLKVIQFQELQNPDLFGKFDVLILSNILERVAFPSSLLRLSAKLLNRGGKLFIEVPNMNNHSYSNNQYGREEINFFSEQSIKQMIKSDGNFTINQIEEFKEPLALKDATYFGMQSKNTDYSSERPVLRLIMENKKTNVETAKGDMNQDEIPEQLYNLSYASLIGSFGLSRFSQTHLISSNEDTPENLTSAENDH